MTTSDLQSKVLAGLLLMGFAGTASAVTVAPGATVDLPGTTAAAEPHLAGTVLVDELHNFSLPAGWNDPSLITGTVQQRVVREDSTGTLDFYWRITNLSGGSLGYFRVGNFANAVFDANYRADGLGDVGPTSITRFNGGIYDNYANFNFADASGVDTLASGQSSLFMFLHTDATQYAKTAFFDVASSLSYNASQTFDAYAPAVPEPESYAMLMAGLGLIGYIARRKKPSV
jgi:hypothetical protein